MATNASEESHSISVEINFHELSGLPCICEMVRHDRHRAPVEELVMDGLGFFHFLIK